MTPAARSVVPRLQWGHVLSRAGRKGVSKICRRPILNLLQWGRSPVERVKVAHDRGLDFQSILASNGAALQSSRGKAAVVCVSSSHRRGGFNGAAAVEPPEGV